MKNASGGTAPTGTVRAVVRGSLEAAVGASAITPLWPRQREPSDMVKVSPDSDATQLDDATLPNGAALACRWCRRPVTQGGRGRPRVFCKRSCRQRDFESRQKAADHGLDEAQLIVARASLNELRDTIYVLQCALEDVAKDFPTGFARADLVELREALGWVVDAAKPVVAHADLG
jgi:hypothetical protein